MPEVPPLFLPAEAMAVTRRFAAAYAAVRGQPLLDDRFEMIWNLLRHATFPVRGARPAPYVELREVPRAQRAPLVMEIPAAISPTPGAADRCYQDARVEIRSATDLPAIMAMALRLADGAWENEPVLDWYRYRLPDSERWVFERPVFQEIYGLIEHTWYEVRLGSMGSEAEVLGYRQIVSQSRAAQDAARLLECYDVDRLLAYLAHDADRIAVRVQEVRARLFRRPSYRLGVRLGERLRMTLGGERVDEWLVARDWYGWEKFWSDNPAPAILYALREDGVLPIRRHRHLINTAAALLTIPALEYAATAARASRAVTFPELRTGVAPQVGPIHTIDPPNLDYAPPFAPQPPSARRLREMFTQLWPRTCAALGVEPPPPPTLRVWQRVPGAMPLIFREAQGSYSLAHRTIYLHRHLIMSEYDARSVLVHEILHHLSASAGAGSTAWQMLGEPVNCQRTSQGFILTHPSIHTLWQLNEGMTSQLEARLLEAWGETAEPGYPQSRRLVELLTPEVRVEDAYLGRRLIGADLACLPVVVRDALELDASQARWDHGYHWDLATCLLLAQRSGRLASLVPSEWL